jgi:hypothetical protein
MIRYFQARKQTFAHFGPSVRLCINRDLHILTFVGPLNFVWFTLCHEFGYGFDISELSDL